MIRVTFTLANNIAKHFRFSPTSIVQGRQQNHLQNIVSKRQQYELLRESQHQAFNAKIKNIQCPFEKEKEEIIFDFASSQSQLTFEDAWLKIDAVEQRQSDQIWKNYSAQRNL